MLSENYWNKGIMTNVIRDVIDKSDLNKFYSITTHTNNGSMKLFKKLGFNEDPSFIDEPDTISFSFIKTI
jgi:RimJ/RimL family protein N-acetyltransferase